MTDDEIDRRVADVRAGLAAPDHRAAWMPPRGVSLSDARALLAALDRAELRQHAAQVRGWREGAVAGRAAALDEAVAVVTQRVREHAICAENSMGQDAARHFAVYSALTALVRELRALRDGEPPEGER